jgi:hypothetical protein
MRSRIVAIGSQIFPSRKDALSMIHAVRDRYVNGTFTVEDEKFLRDLVAIHPCAEEKIGPGINQFSARKNMNNVGFWIERIDGSETDFSFIACLDGDTLERMILLTMRNAVKHQVAPFREAAIAAGVVCSITGERLTSKNCHIDHESPTFIEIASDFISSEGGYECIATVSKEGQYGRDFADEEQEARWLGYHRAHANLRAISKKANLSTLRQGVPRKQRKNA